MIARESFARHVRDALASFYDPVRLQNHPLVELLVPQHGPQETKGQALRELLREAIERLRPDSAIPFGRPEWFGYRIMWLRYVEALDQEQVCQEIGISRASFYRHHQDALQALVSILWDKYQRSEASDQQKEEDRPASEREELLREEAMRLVHASRHQVLNLGEVMQGVERTIAPLIRQQGVRLEVDLAVSLPTISGDPTMLRQIILNLLTEALKFVASSALRIEVTTEHNALLWHLGGLTAGAEQSLANMPGFAISKRLLEGYGGKLWLGPDSERGTAICFAMPTAARRTILIIDNDMDTIRLYRRYLQPHAYITKVVSDGSEAWQFLAETKPDLILLDVLMPREDGWDILQRLKTRPETASIPVIICSVLSQPRLALALGATDVLQKPIDRTALLEAVQRALAPTDNAVTRR